MSTETFCWLCAVVIAFLGGFAVGQQERWFKTMEKRFKAEVDDIFKREKP